MFDINYASAWERALGSLVAHELTVKSSSKIKEKNFVVMLFSYELTRINNSKDIIKDWALKRLKRETPMRDFSVDK